MNAFFSQITNLWRRMTGPQKAGSAAVLGLVLLAGLGTVLFGGATEYRTLATGLGRAESQKLLQKLDEAGVPYRLHASGRDVDVPAARWDEVQALVVQNGLLVPDATRGYAGLTDGSFGLTEAQLKLKMRIAQEEQLALTISRFADIENAVVHVTPAERSWNARDSRPAKASVMLQMNPGRMPTAAEVESVVQLVAHAVEGLEPENVVVTDFRGMILSRLGSFERSMTAARARDEEEHLQQKAESALVQVLGPSRAVVRVDVELDLEKVDETRQVVDPDTQVVVSDSQRSSENAAPAPRGVPSTVPAGPSPASTGSRTEDVETRYDYERAQIRTVKEMGAVKRLTVGVMVDEELRDRGESILGMVKGAVGFNPQRGDTIELAFVPFAEVEAEAPPAEPGFFESGVLIEAGKWGVTGLVGIALAFLVLRSARNARRNLGAALEKVAAERGSLLEKGPDPRDELRRMVEDDVETVGKLLRNWLYEPARR